MQSKEERIKIILEVTKMGDGGFEGSGRLPNSEHPFKTVFIPSKKSFALVIMDFACQFQILYGINIYDNDLKIELKHVNG